MMLTTPQWQRAVREQLKRTGFTQGEAALVLGVGRSTLIGERIFYSLPF